jgi:hypothetical protein
MRDLPVLDLPQRRGLSGRADDGARLQIDPECVLGVAVAGRVRRLDLAHDLRVGLLQRGQHAPGAVGGIAVHRQRLIIGRGRRLTGSGRPLVLAAPAEGVVLRYGWFYGPGTSLAAGEEQFELIRRRKFPLVGDGGGVWSFIHVADAAEATVAAVEHGNRGVYNVADDDPAPVAEWLPALAQTLGAKKPMRVPRFIGRLFAGEAGAVMMTELRGASNAKAKRELEWRPAHPSWRQGFGAA